ncbi:MAG TPA: pyridoxamine 5'-phosphate oxidase [Jatrophihabitans sp.]|nr:pyridoxamine 5'-phosphate oxidase [Jatrophihabitans sp.]
MSEPTSEQPHADPRAVTSSYRSGALTEAELAPTWLAQLQNWYDQAAADPGIPEPNAMQVATVDDAGEPDVRTVLARGFGKAGVEFYTNYDSAKGRALAAHPVAALVFSWLPLERQVRLRGPVERVSRAETETYFAGRPRGSQLAAWASAQSQVLQSREELEQALAEVQRRFGAADDDPPIPPPPRWGGYRVRPVAVEFWQGREFRLHDRLRYRLADSGHWLVERLAP